VLLADVDARFPGAMLRVVAPDVTQLSVLIPPKVMLTGLAVNELMEGRLGCETVTVTVAVSEPVVLVAVRVYVVVTVGLRATEPLAETDAKVPGVIVMLVAFAVVQLSVVLAPAMMAAGLAEKEEMVGAGASAMVGNGVVQPASPAQAATESARTQTAGPRQLRWSAPRFNA
jgi:hypothetical protein